MENDSEQAFVYVIELGGGREYVGETRDLGHRLYVHRNNKSTPWVDEHGFIRLRDAFPTKNPKELEKTVTLWRMREIGWENVRGYSWTRCDLQNPPPVL